jgi:hypothetical protein
MSHVSQCNVVYRNLNDVEAAAKRLGGELRRDKHRFKWFQSKFVDDSTTWKSFFPPEEAERIAKMPRDKRIQIVNAAMNNCDHVIHFDGVNYEVGVFRQPDGTFRLRWDNWDHKLKERMGGPNGGRFAQAYGIEAAKRAARKKGWRTSEKQRDNGHIELEVLVR